MFPGEMHPLFEKMRQGALPPWIVDHHIVITIHNCCSCQNFVCLFFFGGGSMQTINVSFLIIQDEIDIDEIQDEIDFSHYDRPLILV